MMTRRTTRRGSRRRGLATFLLVTLGVFGLTFAGSIAGTAGGMFAAYAYFSNDLPDPNILDGIEPAESTYVYDRSGEVLLARFECQNREAVHFDELPDSVTPEIARTIYRIAQEALANASRHASPSNLSLDLAVANESVTLRTVDDGVGFRTPPGASGAGRGLANMQSRLDQVGGKLTIQNLDRGAMVEATIPLTF